jgi:hypothetical protein
MLCEGAFSLIETDDMNYEILKNASNALKSKNTKLVFTTLNGVFPLFHSVKELINSQEKETRTEQSMNTFDSLTFWGHSVITVVDDSGQKKELQCNER